MNKIAILITSLLIILSGEYFLFTTMQFPPLIEAIVMTQSGQVVFEIWKEENRK